MPVNSSRGNQPSSTGNNNNMRRYALKGKPKFNKKAKFPKKPKQAKKYQVDSSQSAIINKLSKQVFALQMSKYGKVQQNYHTLERSLIPTQQGPLCLDLTDFTCARPASPQGGSGAQIYQHVGGGSNPPVSQWTIQPYTSNFYWKEQNKDQPDGGAYLAMSATYFVEVVGVNSLDNTRIRFDVISQKPEGILPNTVAGTTNVLPDTLGELKHLAQPMGSSSNRINPVYFRKYFAKTVFINSTKSDPNVKGTTANIMRFSFKIKPNKLCTQNLTNPSVGNLDPQPEVLSGNFGPANVHPCQPLWLLISTDDQSPLGDAVSVNMSRRILWRDTIGSANL